MSNFHYDPGDGAFAKVIAGVLLGLGIFILLWLWRASVQEAALIEVAGIGLVILIYVGAWLYGQVTDNRVKVMQVRHDPPIRVPAEPEDDDVITTDDYHLLGSPQSYPSQPFTTRQQREVIYDFNTEGKRIEAQRKAVEHFIDTCYPVCKRQGNWKMEARLYGVTADFLCAIQGAPLLHMGKGYTWREGVTHEDLETWLYQCTHRTTTLPQDEAI